MDIDVRDVELDHIEQVAPLWEQAWRAGGRRRSGMPLGLSLDRMRRRVEAANQGGFRFIAAWADDEPVGLATVSLTDGGPMMDAPGVHIHMLHVADDRRNQGIGTALLVEVVGWADLLGSDQVVVDVPPTSRDVQRWYARWGFGPYLQRRVASTAAIRRRARVSEPAMRGSLGRRLATVSGMRRVANR
ncbi:MAG: GNAT family N-acetyltransferase [Candidatus Nanopelagicales bacterium]